MPRPMRITSLMIVMIAPRRLPPGARFARPSDPGVLTPLLEAMRDGTVKKAPVSPSKTPVKVQAREREDLRRPFTAEPAEGVVASLKGQEREGPRGQEEVGRSHVRYRYIATRQVV